MRIYNPNPWDFSNLVGHEVEINLCLNSVDKSYVILKGILEYTDDYVKPFSIPEHGVWYKIKGCDDVKKHFLPSWVDYMDFDEKVYDNEGEYFLMNVKKKDDLDEYIKQVFDEANCENCDNKKEDKYIHPCVDCVLNPYKETRYSYWHVGDDVCDDILREIYEEVAR